MIRHGPIDLRRRLAGWLWLLAWVSLLYFVVAPWRHLGGIVSERMRWAEYFVLASALATGWAVGNLGRESAVRSPRLSHARLQRWLLYPVGGAVAVALCILRALALIDPIGIVFTGWLAYWAGLDLAFGALPLMAGERYRYSGPIEADDKNPADAAGGGQPPWELD